MADAPAELMTTKALCAAGERRPREREHQVDVDATQLVVGTRRAARRSHAAERVVAAKPDEAGLDLLERHDAVGETRMIERQRSARYRVRPLVFTGVEQQTQQLRADQPARPREQRGAQLQTGLAAGPGRTRLRVQAAGSVQAMRIGGAAAPGRTCSGRRTSR